MNFVNTVKKIFPVIKNKYFIASLLFMIILLFFSQNNLLDRFDNISKLNQLKKDKAYYNKAIENAQRKMEELKTNKKSLEKFAREEYLMKKPNEDIFIIVKEKKD